MTTHKPPLPTRSLGYARHLRGESTDAERKLWQCLRGGQLAGLKFRRFWDNDVLLNLDAVVEAICRCMGHRTLTPTPLPVGEGLHERQT